uniref:Orotate phosphoribosyltransferase n=1 Tax=uncultured Bacteroidota bacterium TaxID=152509 RepID=H5SMA5_9BACT|nr:hypothetical conserved protein [uncultured Bacteroidetes bacterium]
MHALLELVEPLGPLGGVVGVATAGIPWAAWIGEALDLPVGYVRAQPKSHGLGKQVEGLKLPAQDLLVVEDLLSTGGSVERAIAALEAAGGSPKAVAVLWSYELPEAKALPYPVQALLTFSEALGYWEEAGFLSRREADRLRVWHTYGTLP